MTYTYKILRFLSVEDLEKEVTKLLNIGGWKLVGAPYQNLDRYTCQAVVRKS